MVMLNGAATAQAPNALFAPIATVDADPECAPILAEARAAYLGPERSYRASLSGSWVGRLTEVDSNSFPSSREGVMTIPGTRPALYVGFSRNPGCGGACETQSASISRNQDGSAAIHTGGMPEWRFLGRETALYLYGHDEELVTLYRLDGGEPRRACEIRLRPLTHTILRRPSVVAARPAIDVYRESIELIRGDHGQCGSLNTHARLGGEMNDAFEEIFYRPWVFEAATEPPELENWALQGIWEHRLLRESRQAFAAARESLARYYVADLGLSANEAARLAGNALQGAANQGFWFAPDDGSHEEDGEDLILRIRNEKKLRRAILERHPLAEIRAITADAKVVNGWGYGETVLAVAVEYPEALAYLLSLGADPNIANAFGKTPLMYAAQFDQAESITLLSDHSADVNAVTRNPNDNCRYTVSTEDMTALHYAARYARPEAIRRLLKHGALAFLPAHRSRAGETAQQWFQFYSPQNAGQKSRMSDVDRAALERELAVPDQASRQLLAQSFADRAKRAYQARNLESAYRLMRDSQRAAPPSAEALLDFSLIALRAGHIRDSLVAADSARAMHLTDEQRAAAIFNTGLACGQQSVEPLEDTYNYCKEPPLLIFLDSWQTAPSKARESKVAAMLDAMTPQCIVEVPGKAPETYYRVAPGLVVRQGRNSPPSPDIEFQVDYGDKRGVENHRTSLVQRYELQSFSVSLLRGDPFIQGTIRIREQECTLH
jgi:hypothetical protein